MSTYLRTLESKSTAHTHSKTVSFSVMVSWPLGAIASYGRTSVRGGACGHAGSRPRFLRVIFGLSVVDGRESLPWLLNVMLTTERDSGLWGIGLCLFGLLSFEASTLARRGFCLFSLLAQLARCSTRAAFALYGDLLIRRKRFCLPMGKPATTRKRTRPARRARARRLRRGKDSNRRLNASSSLREPSTRLCCRQGLASCSSTTPARSAPRVPASTSSRASP